VAGTSCTIDGVLAEDELAKVVSHERLEVHLLAAEEGTQGASALLQLGIRRLCVEVPQVLACVESIPRGIRMGVCARCRMRAMRASVRGKHTRMHSLMAVQAKKARTGVEG
jgi:hypothetical protein